MPPSTPASLYNQLLMSPTSFPYSSYSPECAANDGDNHVRGSDSSIPVARDFSVPHVQVSVTPSNSVCEDHTNRSSCIHHADDAGAPSCELAAEQLSPREPDRASPTAQHLMRRPRLQAPQMMLWLLLL